MSDPTDEEAFSELLALSEERFGPVDDETSEQREAREVGVTKIRAAVAAIRSAIENGDALAAAACGLDLGELTAYLDLRLYFLDNARFGTVFRQGQSARAKLRWRAAAGIIALIRELAKMKDGLGDYVPPLELWPEMYSALDEEGLDPQEKTKPLRYLYDGGEIKFNAFRKQVQLSRRAAK